MGVERRAPSRRRADRASPTPFVTGDQLDTPLTYEAMRDAGSGLGSRRRHRARRRRRPARRRGGRRPVPRRRVVRAVHAVQAGRPGDRRPARRRCAPVPPDPTTRRRCPTCSPPSPTAPDAPSPASSRSSSAASSPSPADARDHAVGTATASRAGPLLVAELVDIDDGASRLRRGVRRQAARLDLRRDRLRPVPGRPPHRPASRLTDVSSGRYSGNRRRARRCCRRRRARGGRRQG